MLKESESYRRHERDDADSCRSKWVLYEAAKRRIAIEARGADDYEARVQALAREMGI